MDGKAKGYGTTISRKEVQASCPSCSGPSSFQSYVGFCTPLSYETMVRDSQEETDQASVDGEEVVETMMTHHHRMITTHHHLSPRRLHRPEQQEQLLCKRKLDGDQDFGLAH